MATVSLATPIDVTAPAGRKRMYLRGLVAIARSPRPREYVLMHFGSGTFYFTDRLGATAIRILIDGASDEEAIEHVERIEPGSGARARILIDRLETKGTMSGTPATPAGVRWWSRRLAILGLGLSASLIGPLIRFVPIQLLAWMLMRMPATPTSRRIWRSMGGPINSMSAGGATTAKRANPQRNYLFLYLSTLVPADRLQRLVERIFDRASVTAVADRLRNDGPVVAVFLHSPLCIAVPNAVRGHGETAIRIVIPCAQGINLSQASGPLRDFFGESPDVAVALSPANGALTAATGQLLRHLKAGRNVYVALDVPDRKPAAEIEMLGHRFPRNDWPAWLAVRSGRPISLWTTYCTPKGVVLNDSALIHPNPQLPVEARVEDLTKRVYANAEAAIRAHPEAWTFTGHMGLFDLRSP